MKGGQAIRRCWGPHSRAGFSLIEMLFVVGIILLLFVLYWAPNQGSKQRAARLACKGNLERIYIALQIYANEHAATFPSVAGARTSEGPLNLLVPHYTSDTATFICPASPDSASPGDGSLLKTKISYAYYMGRGLTNSSQTVMSDQQVDAQPKVPGQWVFSDTGKAPGNNHGRSGGNFLFGDGHVEPSPAKAAFPLALEPGVVLLNP